MSTPATSNASLPCTRCLLPSRTDLFYTRLANCDKDRSFISTDFIQSYNVENRRIGKIEDPRARIPTDIATRDAGSNKSGTWLLALVKRARKPIHTPTLCTVSSIVLVGIKTAVRVYRKPRGHRPRANPRMVHRKSLHETTLILSSYDCTEGSGHEFKAW